MSNTLACFDDQYLDPELVKMYLKIKLLKFKI